MDEIRGGFTLVVTLSYPPNVKDKNEYDVIVVGAGPAGSIAARYAAGQGVSVLMLEKDRDVGYPVRCAEAINKAGVDMFIEPDRKWIAADVTKFSFTSPDGNDVVIEFDSVPFCIDNSLPPPPIPVPPSPSDEESPSPEPRVPVPDPEPSPEPIPNMSEKNSLKKDPIDPKKLDDSISPVSTFNIPASLGDPPGLALTAIDPLEYVEEMLIRVPSLANNFPWLKKKYPTYLASPFSFASS